MSVIIRLQGLSWSASAMDIRQFFKGLSIPPGGVHIIGGEKGDAFIAFVSDEDARRAMMMNNGVIDGNSVQLFLSSKTEMQNIIGEARNQSTSAPIEQTPAQLQTPPQPYMSDYSKPQNFPPQERFDRGYNRPNEEYNHSQYQQMNISGAPEDDRLMQNQRPPDDLSNRYEDRMAFQQNIPSQPLQRESISSDKRYPPPETSKESYMQPQLRSRDEYERFGSPSQELIPEAVRYGHGQDRIVLGARDGHPNRYGLTGRDTSQEYSSFPTRDQEKFVAPKGDGSDGYEQHVKEGHADRFLPRFDQSFPSNDRNVSAPLESDENNRNRRSQDSPLVNMERKVDIETPYPPYPQHQLVSDHQGWETPKQIPGDDRRQQPFDLAIKSSSFPQDFQPTARYPPDTRYPPLQSQSPFSESQRPYEQRPFDYDGKNQDSLRGDYANRPSHDGKNQDSLHGDYANRPPHEGKYQDSLHGDYANRPPYDMKNRDSLHSDFANRPPYDGKYQDSLHGHYTNMPPHEGKNQDRFHGDYANRPPHEGKYQDSLHGDYANRPHHDGNIQESVHTDFANRPLYDGKNQDGLHADFAKRPPPPFSLQERERDMYPSPLDRKQKDLPNNSLYNPDIFSRDQHIYRRHPEDVVISSLASSEQTRSSDSNDKFDNTLHARRSTGLLETPNPQLRFSDRNQIEIGANKFPNQQQGGVSSSENRKASDENEPPPFWNPQKYEKTKNIHQMPPNFNVPPPKGFDGKPPVSADHLIHIDGRNEYPPSYPPRPPQDMFNRPPPGFMEKPVVDRPPYPERPSYEFSQKKPFEYPNSDNRPPFSYGDAQPQGYERSNTADYSERNLREERRPPFNFDERSQLDTDKDKFNNDAPKQHEHIGKDLLGTQPGVPSPLNSNVDTRFANRSTPISVPNNDNPPLRYGAPSFPNPIDIQKRPPFRDENIPANFSSQIMNVPFRPAVPDTKNIPPLMPGIGSDPDLRRSGPAQQVFVESKGLSQKTNNHRTDGVAGADKKSQDIDKREDHQRSTERTIDIDTRGQKNSDRERLTRLDVDNRQRRDVDGRADVDRRDRERDRERDNRDKRREVTDRYNRDDRSRSDMDRRRNDNDRRDERQRDRGRDYDRSRDFDRSRDYDRFRDYDRSRIDRDRDRDSRYDSRYRDDRDSRRSPRNRDKTTDEFGRDIKPDRETRREQSSSEKNLQNKVIQPAQPDKTNNDSFKNTFSEVSKQIPPPRSVSSNVSSQKNNTSLQSIPIPSSPQQAVAGKSSSSTVSGSPVTSSINPQQLHSVSLSSASKSSAPTSSGVRISGSGTTVAKSTPVINTSPSGPRPLTGTAVKNFRPAVSTIGNQRVDPSTLPGLLGAAPPGVRPILMSNPQMLSMSKRKSDLEPKGKSASTPEASIKNTPPQTLPTSSSAPIVPPKVVDADDPKGLKRQYRQATPSLTIVVKNLPLNSGYRDVRKFFQGCEIPWDGLKMINDEHGKRIGVAYINFCSSQAYFESIEKNGKKMNENTIEVKPCKQDEYDKAVDSYIPSKENEAKKPKLEEPTQPKTSPSKVMTKDFVIQVKGWAQCVNKDELKRFFKDMKISNNGDGIYIEHDQQKRPTGMAMLKFEKEVDYIRALGMDLRQVAGKTVHIKSATQKELDDMKQSKNQIGNKTENTDLKSASGDAPKCEFTCVHLQGLPPYITSKDLQYTLFNGLEFGNRGIQLVQDSNGKPLGEAFAEFISESECARALKKDGEILMRKQVIVKPILKTEMLDLLRMIKQPIGRLSSGSQYGRRSTYYVKTENWPFTISIREVISFFQGFNPIQETVRVQIGNDMQGSAAMVGFRSQEDADRAVKSLNNKYYRQRAIRMEPALM